jgi:hypothetical protein
MYVNVHIDESDVLRKVGAEDLRDELERRKEPAQKPLPAHILNVYEHYRRVGGAPECVREMVWDVLGRVL